MKFAKTAIDPTTNKVYGERGVERLSDHIASGRFKLEDEHMVLMIEDHLIASPEDKNLFDIFFNEVKKNS